MLQYPQSSQAHIAGLVSITIQITGNTYSADVQQQITRGSGKCLKHGGYRLDILFCSDDMVDRLFPILHGGFSWYDSNLLISAYHPAELSRLTAVSTRSTSTKPFSAVPMLEISAVSKMRASHADPV